MARSTLLLTFLNQHPIVRNVPEMKSYLETVNRGNVFSGNVLSMSALGELVLLSEPEKNAQRGKKRVNPSTANPPPTKRPTKSLTDSPAKSPTDSSPQAPTDSPTFVPPESPIESSMPVRSSGDSNPSSEMRDSSTSSDRTVATVPAQVVDFVAHDHLAMCRDVQKVIVDVLFLMLEVPLQQLMEDFLANLNKTVVFLANYCSKNRSRITYAQFEQCSIWVSIVIVPFHQQMTSNPNGFRRLIMSPNFPALWMSIIRRVAMASNQALKRATLEAGHDSPLHSSDRTGHDSSPCLESALPLTAAAHQYNQRQDDINMTSGDSCNDDLNSRGCAVDNGECVTDVAHQYNQRQDEINMIIAVLGDDDSKSGGRVVYNDECPSSCCLSWRLGMADRCCLITPCVCEYV